VFRGYEESTGTSKVRVFTYDGLYQCVDSWVQKGISGFDVVKFRMQRQEGQPPLSSQQVYFIRSSLPSSMKASDRPGLITADISNGRERIPVCVVNEFEDGDASTRAPRQFDYLARMKHLQEEGPACSCASPEDCVDPEKCACARRNAFGFPYVEGGRLKESGQGVVYECGPGCRCGHKCRSRVVQKGLSHRLEVFMTQGRGFGVRSWDFIQVGSFICEYIGRILTDQEAHECEDDSYLFNIDPATDGLVGAELGSGATEATVAHPSDVEYSIDALNIGNVGRFVNHSCTPNALVQSVLFDHHNPRLSHIALFAYDNIPPGQEITYDYNYKVGTVIGANEEEKVLDCRCGNKPPVCKGRLY
jgi:euchromatic histone-lysine N-methyltransferase